MTSVGVQFAYPLNRWEKQKRNKLIHWNILYTKELLRELGRSILIIYPELNQTSSSIIAFLLKLMRYPCQQQILWTQCVSSVLLDFRTSSLNLILASIHSYLPLRLTTMRPRRRELVPEICINSAVLLILPCVCSWRTEKFTSINLLTI